MDKKKYDHLSDLRLLHDWSDLETIRAYINKRLFERIVTNDEAVEKSRFLPHHLSTKPGTELLYIGETLTLMS